MGFRVAVIALGAALLSASSLWAAAPLGGVDLLNIDGATVGGLRTPVGRMAPSAYGAYQDLQNGYSGVTSDARSYAYSSGGINVLILGDGYRSADYARYQYVATRAVNALNANPEFQQAGGASRVRFYPYFLPSNQSGASSYGRQQKVDTYLGATYADNYAGDTSIWVDFNKTWGVAQQIAPGGFHYVLVLVNQSRYAATSWSTRICVVPDFDRTVGVTNPAVFEDIVCHEFLGHSLADLWDEYVYKGSAPGDVATSPNCTASTSPRWYDLVGWQQVFWNYVQVGLYGGCSMSSYYRPTAYACKMNLYSSQPFCPVCRRQVLRVLASY